MKHIITPILLVVVISIGTAKAQNKKWEYFNKIKIGFLPGLNDPDDSPFKQRGSELSVINGVYLGSQTAIGIGIGSAAYVDPTIAMYPVYADFEYYFRNKKNTPFVYSKLGYAFTITKSNIGGVMGGVGAGWRFKSGKNGYWGIESGYRQQQYGYKFSNVAEVINEQIRSISIAVNFSF